MDNNLIYKRFNELILLFFFGLFAGCIYFHVLCYVKGPLFLNEWGMVFDPVIECSIKDMYNAYHRYHNRVLLFHILVCSLGFFRIGKIALEGLIISSGFLVGASETLILLNYDIKEGFLFGIKVFVVAFLPGLLLSIGVVMACTLGKSEKWKQIPLRKYVFWFFLTVALHMVYNFMYGYVNLRK